MIPANEVEPIDDEPAVWSELDTVVNQGTTTWSQYYPDQEHVHVDTKHDLQTSNLETVSTEVKFYSEIANQAYQTNLDYFLNPLVLSQNIVGSNTQTAYRRIKDYDAQLGDITKVYAPIETGQVSNDKPIYISFKGTDNLWSLYQDISIVADYTTAGWTSTNLGTFNTEVNTIYNTLKSYLNDSPRPIILVGHSLGGYYGLHVMKKLVENHPAIVTKGIKAHFFNPLTLVDEAFTYFRDMPSVSTFNPKQNINIHSINGDFVSGLFVRKGLGTVHWYNAPVDGINKDDVDNTSFTLKAYLTDLFNVNKIVDITRNSYANLENHKIAAFGGENGQHTAGLLYAQLIPGLANEPATFTSSIRTVKQKNIGPFLDPYVATQDANLDVFDIVGTQSNKLWVDYPKHDTTIGKYNFTFTKSSGTNLSSWYVISSIADAQGNITRYINFPYQSTSAEFSGTTYEAFYVLMGTYYLITPDGTNYFRLPSNTDTSNLPLQATTQTLADYNALVSEGSKDNFRFTFIPHISIYDTHWSNRRTHDSIQSAPVVYTGLRALFQSQYSGAYGYFNIRMIGANYNVVGNTDPLYLYMEDGSNKTVYARPGNPTNTSQGLFGIDHNDNSTNPDEHVWKITWVEGDKFTIQNTVLDGTSPKYFGEMGSVSGDTSSVRKDTPPQILATAFSDPNPSNVFFLDLIGNTQNYSAYHYVVNTLYHYVDFNHLNTTNYNFSKLQFEFTPI